MAGHFDGPDIGEMGTRVIVIMLHYPRRVEVVDKRLGWFVDLGRPLGHAVVHGRVLEVRVRVEILVRLVDLVHPAVGCSGEPGVAVLIEAEPDGHEYDLSIGPFAMYALDDLGDAILVGRRRHVICLIAVICADIDDDYIGRWTLAKVPWFWIVWRWGGLLVARLQDGGVATRYRTSIHVPCSRGHV